MSEATEMSYKTYLTQLELALQHSENSPQIMFNEQTALKMIVSIMKNLAEMAGKEKGLINSLDEEQNKLRSLQKAFWNAHDNYKTILPLSLIWSNKIKNLLKKTNVCS